MSTEWNDTISIIIIFAGSGAIIDFIIGKRGQKEIIRYLESIWLRLSYVNLHNLAQLEATFALRIIDIIFGSIFFTIHRLMSTIGFALSCTLLWIIAVNLNDPQAYSGRPINFAAIRLTISLISFAVSISATRWVTKFVAEVGARTILGNATLVLSLLVMQYVLLVLWVETFGITVNTLSKVIAYGKIEPYDYITLTDRFYAIFEDPLYYLDGYYAYIIGKHYLLNFWNGWFGIYNTIVEMSVYFSSLFRLLLFILYLMSILANFLKNSLLFIIERLVEYDKPIFTIILGGFAALLKSTYQLFSMIN